MKMQRTTSVVGRVRQEGPHQPEALVEARRQQTVSVVVAETLAAVRQTAVVQRIESAAVDGSWVAAHQSAVAVVPAVAEVVVPDDGMVAVGVADGVEAADHDGSGMVVGAVGGGGEYEGVLVRVVLAGHHTVAASVDAPARTEAASKKPQKTEEANKGLP